MNSEPLDSASHRKSRLLPAVLLALSVASVASVATAISFFPALFSGSDAVDPTLATAGSAKQTSAGTGTNPSGSNSDENPTTGSDTTGSDTTGSDTTGSDTTGSDTTGSDTTGSDKEDADVARIRKLLSGTWTRSAYGIRTLTIHSDGTAHLSIHPSALYVVVFGARIDARIQWELQDGFLDYRVTSAVPAEKFELARKTWGDHWHEKIKILNATTLTLLGDNGKEYVWTRKKDTKELEADQST